jgi:cell division protein FtsL
LFSSLDLIFFRHREAELVAALEGVVKRCQELESEHLKLQQQQSRNGKLRR